MDINMFFVEMLSAYLNETVPVIPNDVDWDRLEYLTKINNVYIIIFSVVNRLGLRPPVYDNLKQGFYASVALSANQDIAAKRLIDRFTRDGVEHMLFKGLILRECYPERDARSFGDIDILINEGDREKSHKILIDMGYEYREDIYSKDVWTYQKDSVVFEIHTCIISQNLFNDYDYVSYFKNKVNNRVLISGCTYRFRNEEHLIYIIAHLAKHFYTYGVGIRMYMDIAVFLKKYSGELDFDYVKNELKKIRLYEFAQTVFAMCNELFNTDIECDDLSETSKNILLDYIVCHGVFGYDNKNVIDVKYRSGKGKKIRELGRRIFPDLETMKNLNSWFSNGKAYQLPYAYVRRWLNQLGRRNKRRIILKKIRAMLYTGSDAQKHEALLKIIGLK